MRDKSMFKKRLMFNCLLHRQLSLSSKRMPSFPSEERVGGKNGIGP